MPVYIRKNVSYTPPSLDKLPQEQEDDFVNDPELLRDDLPQPYRMIDKTVRNLIDETWEIIAEREEERLAEARRVKPPQYQFSQKLEAAIPGTQFAEKQSLSYATSVCNSPDGNFVFFGLPCGIAALHTSSQQFQGAWEEENAEITYIRSYIIGPEMYLIVTIDDMGIGRLFAYTYSKMFLLKVLNSQESDSNKILVSKIEASSAGDYIGVVMENPSNQDLWLEIHKLPRDPWVSDLETIVNALKKKEEKKEEQVSEVDAESIVASEQAGSQGESQDMTPNAAPTDGAEQSQSAPSLAGSMSSAKSIRFNMFSRGSMSKQQAKKRVRSRLDSVSESRLDSIPELPPIRRLYHRQSYRRRGKKYQSRPGSEVSQQGPADPAILNMEQPKDPLSGDYKFASPQLIMKVNPTPHVTITGASFTNVQAACQKVESGDVVGTGQNSLFTQAHLEMRKAVFDSIHENLLKYLPQDEESIAVQQYPNFHFLTAGRMLPMGLEQPTLQGRPTTVAVWWPGSNNLIQYSLIKTSKDLDFKPDLVWPFTCKITSSEISEDTNIIAVGLENGNVVIWDRYMGTQRGVVTVGDNIPVVQLKFLDPSMYPQDPVTYPPYPTKVSAYLLAMCANSSMYCISTGPGITLQPNTISAPVETDDDTVTVLQPFTSHPDMLLTVTRKGSIEVRDTMLGKIICQINLPDGFEISSPWDPILALGENGRLLYVKGTKKLEEDASEIDGNSQLQNGSVFVYQLRSFPTLDEYWKRERASQSCTVHTTIDQRVDAILADRLKRQEARKNRLQERWTLLKNEVESIHNLKCSTANRPVVTPGSVGLNPYA